MGGLFDLSDLDTSPDIFLTVCFLQITYCLFGSVNSFVGRLQVEEA